jgi:tetratricopeptide (TPR) repeat protein
MWIRGKRLLFLAITLIVAGLGMSLVFFWPTDQSEIQAAQQALDRRNFSEARQHLRKYLVAHPDDLSALLLAAEAARRDGDLGAAGERLAEFADAKGPESALELERRLLAVQRGDAAEADLVFEFCQAHPDAPETPFVIEALIVADLNRLAVPLSLDAFLGIEPAPPELARLHQAIGLWLEDRLAPADQVQGLIWRGRAKGLSGDQPGAVADLQQALDLAPDHFEARAYLALAINQENPVKSLEHFEILLQRYPSDVRVQFAVASIRRSLGELDAARELLDQILRERPSSSQVLVERASVALDARNAQEARPFLEKAAELSPDSADVQLALTRWLTMLGDTAAAKRHQERFLELDAKRAAPRHRFSEVEMPR